MDKKQQHSLNAPSNLEFFEENLAAWKGPAIALVDLDAFFASVEQLDNPGWRGKPVVVGGKADKHGVVAAASYEARVFGVRSAMPAIQATRLCPDAIWTRGHYNRYRELSDQVMEILGHETPHVQQVSIDEAFLDISPTRFNHEHPARIVKRIQDEVEKLGVTCSIGVGISKSIAKISSDIDKPRGLTIVYPGQEKAFLAPLPIKVMSGIGPAAQNTLHEHGIKTLGDLASAEQAILKRVFGKNADMMRARSIGKDISAVNIEREVKSVSNEMTFSEDLTTENDIRAAIAAMASKVGRRLRKKSLKGKTIALKIRFSDRSTHTVQKTLESSTNDELFFTPLLFEMVNDLWSCGAAVRLIGVGVSGFDDTSAVQDVLFDVRQEAPLESDIKPILEDAEKRGALLEATDKVKNRFGEEGVRFGSEVHIKDRSTGTIPKNPSDYREQ